MAVLARRAFLLAAVGALAGAPGAALAAHAASVLKVVEEGEIDAPSQKVWAILSDFAHADWLPGVARVDAEGDNTPDKAKRRLTLADGGVVVEMLTRWDGEKMMIGVHREGDDVKRLPVVNFTNIATARPVEGGKTIVEWKARFYRGFPNPNPPPELNDDVAIAAVTALLRADIAALKKRVEGK
jgi:carbon monoxide dehydrogenase subunit G